MLLRSKFGSIPASWLAWDLNLGSLAAEPVFLVLSGEMNKHMAMCSRVLRVKSQTLALHRELHGAEWQVRLRTECPWLYVLLV